jgi:hypothetical protein
MWQIYLFGMCVDDYIFDRGCLWTTFCIEALHDLFQLIQLTLK